MYGSDPLLETALEWRESGGGSVINALRSKPLAI